MIVTFKCNYVTKDQGELLKGLKARLDLTQGVVNRVNATLGKGYNGAKVLKERTI